jgi:uncharacterized damage-inducible protein DinB
MVATMNALGRTFLDDSRAFLAQDYMPKIERCVTQLTEEQMWTRANEASNSIGNLILHLTGSSRYWALEVIGGKPIGRIRQLEFDRRDPIPADRLLADLRAAMAQVDQALSHIPPETLLERRTAREEQTTVLWCVYHLVEHFGMHTGQILTMAKAMVGEVQIETP